MYLFALFVDDDNNDEQDADGIQKLLQSSLSPRHSPMPFHQQLRQSIRSSMLKEVSGLILTTSATLLHTFTVEKD